MTRTVLAPGKLMIAGEYAVLDGAPAIVLAIDRGVRCDIVPADTLTIQTPDGDDRFVRPALSDLDEKPGFGGSAAACVAACLAAGRPAADAVRLHQQIQGGGSGADVAAAIHGGMLRFEGHDTTALDPVTPVVVWSGQSTRTQPMIDRYLAWPDREVFVAASRRLVQEFTRDPIAALRENAHLLMDMATRAGVPYMTPRLAAIAKAAHHHGGAAKPSGAGGGDCAIAFFPDKDAESAFVHTCTDNGWPVIPVQPAVGAGLTSG